MVRLDCDEQPLAVGLHRDAVYAISKLDIADNLQRSEIHNADVIPSAVSHIQHILCGSDRRARRQHATE
jgi:hypothetical protein